MIRLKKFAPIVVAVSVSPILLKWVPVPYVWLAVCWALCFAWLALVTRWHALKGIGVSLATCSLMVGALEAFSYFAGAASSTPPPVLSYSRTFMVPDEALGYAPVKNTVVRARLKQGDETIYDVAYTIDGKGLRATPNTPSPDEPCLLFFGDSFTFGVGVEDHEASPYVVAERTGLAAYNFGFVGYGPHQMLRALESGLVERTVQCRPVAVVYQALMEHGARAAGWSEWDRHGPKYVLDGGALRYAGHFDDYAAAKLQMQMKKSISYMRYVWPSAPVSLGQSRLALEILKAGRQHLQRLYPEASFHLILWDFGAEDHSQRMFVDGLRQHGVQLSKASSILPDFPAPALEIGGGDQHPNPLAHRLIAEHIVENIVQGNRNAWTR